MTYLNTEKSCTVPTPWTYLHEEQAEIELQSHTDVFRIQLELTGTWPRN
jgi:hypothetical protein